MAEASSYLAVIAIDFGTSYCGFALSLSDEPKTIRAFNPCTGSVKTPTVVLTDAATKFVALGYDALDKYSTFSEEEVKSHRLFQGFKMVLHYEKDLSYHTLIKDSKGQPCPAIDIFAMVLEDLADRALKQIRKEVECDLEQLKQRIRWVITVPAIWTDTAKQFMKEAAYRSGIVESTETRNLFLALEPETASLYCHSEPVKSTGESSCKMEVGDQYLVLDCGGGTLDATAHEVRGHNDIAEICIANGGPIGAAKVNDNFLVLLDKIFGKLLMDKYKRMNQDFITLMAAFEAKKKSFDDSSSRFALPISTGIVEVYQELYKGIQKPMKEVLDAIVTAEYKQRGVKIASSCLQIPTSVVMEIFTPVVNDIIKHAKTLLEKPELKDVKRILMVGGFSDCVILQRAIRDTFGDRYSVLIPAEAWGVVVKGAVMYGHNPSAISVRIARKTYGVRIRGTFDEKIHDPAKKFVEDGEEYCNDCFDVFVKQGDEVTNDMNIPKSYLPVTATQQSITMGIYTALSRTPMYTDEPGVEKIGSIRVKLPGTGLDRSVEVTMYFGRTAIEVEGRDEREGGDLITTKVDLFSR